MMYVMPIQVFLKTDISKRRNRVTYAVLLNRVDGSPQGKWNLYTGDCKRGVNETSVQNFLYPLVTWICIVFFYPKHISNGEWNGDRPSFLTSGLQQPATLHFNKAPAGTATELFAMHPIPNSNVGDKLNEKIKYTWVFLLR